MCDRNELNAVGSFRENYSVGKSPGTVAASAVPPRSVTPRCGFDLCDHAVNLLIKPFAKASRFFGVIVYGG